MPLMHVMNVCVCVVCVCICNDVVIEVWVQVPLKSTQDLCDDVIDTSTDLNDSSETSSCQAESRDTWHW